MQWVRVPNEMRHLYLSPHPSREGRAHFLAVACGWWRIEVARVKVAVVVVGWVEEERISTVMGLMSYLNSAHPHRLRLI